MALPSLRLINGLSVQHVAQNDPGLVLHQAIMNGGAYAEARYQRLIEIPDGNTRRSPLSVSNSIDAI